MTVDRVVLGASALVFLSVALQGLFLPRRILDPLGGAISTPSVANEIRANYGGMHLGIAILLGMGAAQPDFRVPALMLLLVFTGGLCVGRALSWVLDGAPNTFVRVFFALEAVGTAAAAVLLAR